MTAYPSPQPLGLPALTADQMREVDRLMREDFHIDLTQMMENAGRHLADFVRARYCPVNVTVLAGAGGNGGGGLVAARHLANRGTPVTVVLAKPPGEYESIPARQLRAVSAMGITVADEPPPDSWGQVIIDALIGYSLDGSPTGRVAELIAWANAATCPVVILDTPSGLDVTSGATPGAYIVADSTLTLAAPKVGLFHSFCVGSLFVADISVPAAVYERLGFAVHEPFAQGSILSAAHW